MYVYVYNAYIYIYICRGRLPCQAKPSPASSRRDLVEAVYMRNLLGWLETRPAQIALTYLKLA